MLTKRFESLCPVCRSEVTLCGGMGADVYVCPNKCRFANDDVIVKRAQSVSQPIEK